MVTSPLPRHPLRSCDEPPTLSKFTPYRDDGKEGLKFYTDRNYFYDLWVQQQTQLIKDRKKRVSHAHFLSRPLPVISTSCHTHFLSCPL